MASDPSPAARPAVFREFSIRSGGLDRTFVVYVPQNVSRAEPAAGLVLFFHGYTGTAEYVCAVSSYQSFQVVSNAELNRFIAVCPQGYYEPPSEAYSGWNSGTCCGYSALHRIDDVSFVSELLDHLQTSLFPQVYDVAYPSQNVFAFGFSTGGLFSHRLACELTDRFDGIGVMGAAWDWGFYQGVPGWQSRCTASVSTWSGVGTRDDFVPVGRALAGWQTYSRDVMGCAASVEPESVGVGVTCRTFTSCGDVNGDGRQDKSRFCIYDGMLHSLKRMQTRHQWQATCRAWNFLSRPNASDAACPPYSFGGRTDVLRMTTTTMRATSADTQADVLRMTTTTMSATSADAPAVSAASDRAITSCVPLAVIWVLVALRVAGR